MKTSRELAIQCFKDEAEAVMGLTDQLDENFDEAVRLMYDCKGKVIVTGVGKSGHIGAKIAATLSSTGTPSFFINPLDVFHGDLGVMTPDDVVLAISNSGQTDELLRFIPMVLHMQIPIIGHQLYDGTAGHGRRLGRSPHREASLPAERLCTVPSWRRTW